MNRSASIDRRSGFTLVELLLSIALGVLVAAVLAALIHGLLAAGEGQAARLRGPRAVRDAVRTLSREIACAFAPPVKDLVPLRLAASTEPGKPEVRLDFYAPVPAVSALAHGYDIEQVAYEVWRIDSSRRELRRISVPCSGPYTNAPVTNWTMGGRFELAIEAVTNGAALAEWPPPGAREPRLPPSLRLSLRQPGEAPVQTEVLVQCATGIRSPVERKEPEPEPEPAEK